MSVGPEKIRKLNLVMFLRVIKVCIEHQIRMSHDSIATSRNLNLSISFYSLHTDLTGGANYSSWLSSQVSDQ